MKGEDSGAMLEARAVLQSRDAGGLDQHGEARRMRMRGSTWALKAEPVQHVFRGLGVGHEKEQTVQGDAKAFGPNNWKNRLGILRWNGESGFCRMNYEG